ncbi:MAG: hypothetical protein WEB28_01865 [Nitrosopumilaceae archaeon]
MGKILRTVNLIVNALKPKQVTLELNEDGTGYNTYEKEIVNKFDIELLNPTTEELEIPYETYLTASGIPWCGPKKKIKSIINNKSFANPKYPIEEPEDQKIDELKTIREMQETLASKLKPKKQIENEPEMNISSSQKCRFTREELAREKKADFETRKRLQAFLEEIKTKNEKDIATLFDPLQGVEYYLNRYNSEPVFKAWFDTNFRDCSIEEVLELAIPVTFSKSKSKLDLHFKNSDLQKYIDIYNNEPMYKDWFDRKYPGYTIYDIIGIPKLNKPTSHINFLVKHQ